MAESWRAEEEEELEGGKVKLENSTLMRFDLTAPPDLNPLVQTRLKAMDDVLKRESLTHIKDKQGRKEKKERQSNNGEIKYLKMTATRCLVPFVLVLKFFMYWIHFTCT